MLNYILFDDATRSKLLPFTHTRPIADIRCGILTMRERWEHLLGSPTSTLTVSYLQDVFPVKTANKNIFINGRVFATSDLVNQISNLAEGEKLIKGEVIIAANLGEQVIPLEKLLEHTILSNTIEFNGETNQLCNIWDIFSLNDFALKSDYELLTHNRKSEPLPEDILVSGTHNIFIEKGGKINMGCIINAIKGPVYIGKDAELLEGVAVRGPLAVCEQAVVKMGAKIYGPTTIGPGCKVGGEINNVVFFANSNKGHDGYLGNTIIGEWCNLGADTNSSNLKNNYDEVKVHSEQTGGLVKTGLVFCGLMMADHSKCGINTMFNTGTVVGVSANIYGGGFPDKFIPSFSWGGSEGMVTYQFEKAMETANRMMARRGKTLHEVEIKMYKHIFDATSGQRQ